MGSNNIFYSEDALEFINSFQPITSDNQKVIKQIEGVLLKGDFNRVLISLRTMDTGNKWIKRITLSYECYLDTKVMDTISLPYITEFRTISE